MSLNIINLSKSYDKHVVFENFSLSLRENEINCILGESGCGKTTLLNIIAQIDEEFTGQLEGFRNLSFSYIFQETRLLPWYTVYQNLEVILHHADDKEDIIETYLKLVGLIDYKGYYPYQLSGGMKQRLSIARAFAFKSDILLMDEPFKGLDPGLKKILIEAFIDLWEQDKRTIIFVTHDIDEALLLGDDVYILGGNPIRKKLTTSIKCEKKKRLLDMKEIKKKKELIYKTMITQEELT